MFSRCGQFNLGFLAGISGKVRTAFRPGFRTDALFAQHNLLFFSSPDTDLKGNRVILLNSRQPGGEYGAFRQAKPVRHPGRHAHKQCLPYVTAHGTNPRAHTFLGENLGTVADFHAGNGHGTRLIAVNL
ncbi:MAG: hypothetical protein BWX80_04181 [Candidatus Hydrogenedentes bacterium ADurb.Bin101]|nr:MAG: hypothetical protein BWX80_04181 [Candidatus Hydrogenedentes bacterium ADurb.Bin101]